MKWLFLFIAALVGGAFWAFPRYLSTDARHERASRALVHAIRSDELAHHIFIQVYRRSHDRGRITADELRCMETATVEDFNKAIARNFAETLTPQELAAAEEFFESPVGIKYMRMVHREVAKGIPDYPIADAGEEPTLDVDDLEALVKFRNEPRTRKVSDPDLLMGNTSEHEKKFMRDKRADCVHSGT